MTADPRADCRFLLVSAGHRFLQAVLPLHRPTSDRALSTFIRVARDLKVSHWDTEVVLTSILSVMDRHVKCLPSLVDRYCAGAPLVDGGDGLARFAACFEELLRYEGIGDLAVQRAIQIIHSSYSDCKTGLGSIARLLGRHPSHLTVAFKRHTTLTSGEYLQGVRLQHAARLLLSTDKSVKEVWSEVGYKHAANFNHDFKRVFGVNPRTYRASAVQAWADEKFADPQRGGPESRVPNPRGDLVLIVDDDDVTRSTCRRFLSLRSFRVATASTAAECLEQVAQEVPAAILLEYRLPDMDGVECLRALRRWPTASDVAVVLFTADFEVYDRDDEIRALNGLIASKLCALCDVETIVGYLIGAVPVRDRYAPASIGGDRVRVRTG